MSGTGPAAAGALVDSHCHLQVLAEREESGGVERALEEAAAAGVEQVVCPGLNLEDSDRCREIAETHAGVFFTVGWHPHEHAAPDRVQVAELAELLRHPRAVGVGEIGLDQYWRPGYHETPLEVQRAALRQMLELARDRDLPAAIHDRDSHEEVLAAVDELPGLRGVMHSFTGDAAHARRCRERGLLLSFSGIVTFPPQRGHPGGRPSRRPCGLPGGDGHALPGARPAPWPAQRARLRRRHRGRARPPARRPGRRGRQGDHRQRARSLRPARRGPAPWLRG